MNGGLASATTTLADGSKQAPEPLTEAKFAVFARTVPKNAPPPVRGDFPEWLAPSFARALTGVLEVVPAYYAALFVVDEISLQLTKVVELRKSAQIDHRHWQSESWSNDLDRLPIDQFESGP